MDIFAPSTIEQIDALIIHYLLVILSWWWLYLPPVLFLWARYLYLYWQGDRFYAKNVNPILLEIKIPEEVAKTPKAMEQVFAGWWQLYDPPNWREKWEEGKFLLSFTCEIVGIEGKPHFYIRIPKGQRRLFESHLYAQYSDAEVTEVQDYAKAVPQDVPNADWDVWGFDFEQAKAGKDYLPIKTYIQFEEESTKEEKRVDPISNLLDGIAKLQKGEQVWLQIRVMPILGESEWRKEGEKEIRRIVEKKKEIKLEPFFSYMAKGVYGAMVEGKSPAGLEEKEEKIDFGALTLAPNEMDVVKGIATKISKQGYICSIRSLSIGKKGSFFKQSARAPMSYISGILASPTMQSLKYSGKTGTKIVYFFKKRRLYIRKRRLFRYYASRFSPLYPKSTGAPLAYVLNSEELATLFHFPGREAAPVATLERVEAKKSEPPATLPIE